MFDHVFTTNVHKKIVSVGWVVCNELVHLLFRGGGVIERDDLYLRTVRLKIARVFNLTRGTRRPSARRSAVKLDR